MAAAANGGGGGPLWVVCGLTHHSQRLNLIVLAAGSSFIEIFVIYVVWMSVHQMYLGSCVQSPYDFTDDVTSVIS